MEKLKIVGGNKLSGTISCSGAKNAALPMLAATILSDKPVTFKNLPYLQDITTMFEILGSMGADITLNESMDFIISTANLNDFEARYELVKTMRASILVLGSLVAKHGFARIALPGGCAIGSRPVNFHLDALEQLGAKIELKSGYIEASCSKLVGCEINFPGISVTGTENIMMAAVLAKGQTILRNVAKEPEVEDLANFLNSMGAKVSGAGTDEIVIDGVDATN
jgi:UDP-N-acetylglucosamine 1-carboxyvinyltransferase